MLYKDTHATQMTCFRERDKKGIRNASMHSLPKQLISGTYKRKAIFILMTETDFLLRRHNILCAGPTRVWIDLVVTGTGRATLIRVPY